MADILLKNIYTLLSDCDKPALHGVDLRIKGNLVDEIDPIFLPTGRLLSTHQS